MRSLVSLVVLSLLTACSDDISKRSFPRIAVQVDSQAVSEGATTSFGGVLQQTVAKTVTVQSGGEDPLVITSVNWEIGDDGQPVKNDYLEIDFLGGVDASSFPWTVENANSALTFAVEFTPPVGRPLDDFSDSVLVIKTNAFDDLGRAKVPEFRLTFSMNNNAAIPLVTPTSYEFRNATIAKGESQDFRIYNDLDRATASFQITSVRLENPSDEFILSGTPAAGTTVLAPGDPGYREVVFTVTYQPKDDIQDTNAILITTSVGAGAPLRVSLKSSSSVGNFSLSYEHANAFDFSNVSQVQARSVQLTCEGPGTMAVKQPRIEPAEARQDFTVKAFRVATPSTPEAEVTSWPQGLNVQRALRFEVTFAPANDGTDTANGQLIIPYENPGAGEIVIDLLSGDPKSKIVIAPMTELIAVSGASGTGTRTVVIYNEGNGPLQVKGATVYGNFQLPAKVWSLTDPFEAFSVAPGDLALLEVSYDIGAIAAADGSEIEYLDITYFDDFTGSDQKRTIGLSAERTTVANPVASLGSAGDYPGAVVGQAVTLNTSGSSFTGGTIDPQGYLYYLVAKPAGSKAKLNRQGGPGASFVPDIAGAYVVELVVYAASGGTYVYSAPAQVTITVGAAP